MIKYAKFKFTKKIYDFLFGFSVLLRNTYSHLAEYQCSMEHSLGNAVLDYTLVCTFSGPNFLHIFHAPMPATSLITNYSSVSWLKQKCFSLVLGRFPVQSRLGHHLSQLRFSLVTLYPSRWMLGTLPHIGYHSFLLHSFQLIIHESPYHLSLYYQILIVSHPQKTSQNMYH